MTGPRWRDRLLLNEDLNFLLTNRVPRRALTALVGAFSRIRSRWLTRLSVAVWRQFTELDLSDAATQDFDSLQAVFTRALQPGARPLDPDPRAILSPCDALVGACGTVRAGQLFQAKGMAYTIDELFDGDLASADYRDGGGYVTLRLTSAMYHRFHAPGAGRVGDVRYISGDTWNVNPIALRRVERLFCRNERALIPLQLDAGPRLMLVPVAAILVASIRLHALDVRPYLREQGTNRIPLDAAVVRGQELGWFEHGSTILVFCPPGVTLAPGLAPGQRLRMGEPLMQLPQTPPS